MFRKFATTFSGRLELIIRENPSDCIPSLLPRTWESRSHALMYCRSASLTLLSESSCTASCAEMSASDMRDLWDMLFV